MVTALGTRPAGSFGWACLQLEVSRALQVAALMTEILTSWRLATTTLRFAGSKAMSPAPKPTLTLRGVCPHPVLVVALQVAPLMTETVPAPSPFCRLAT